MARFVSTRSPNLWLPALRVRFRGGVAEVDDPATAERLSRIGGVRLAEGEKLPNASGEEESSTPGIQPAEPAAEAAESALPEPPPLSAPKDEHRGYAVDVLGLDKAEVEGLTKLDLVERIRTARA